MEWENIRKHYPHQWLLVEAIKAHSELGKRVLEQLTVVNTFENSISAMNHYREVHNKLPDREFYVLHTDREELDIPEHKWLGIHF